jgi:hypothetical protein
MKLLLFILLFFNSFPISTSCIKHNIDRDVNRQVYINPEQIQSEHFIVHFTTADNDFQEINGQLYSLQSNYGYAQSIIYLMSIQLNI